VIIGRNRESGALRMAQEIARRHARIGTIARSVPLVLRHARAFSVNHFHVVRPYSFAPRLSFDLSTNRDAVAPARPVARQAREPVEKFVRQLEERFVRVASVVERTRTSPTSAERGDRTPARPGPNLPKRAPMAERVLARPMPGAVATGVSAPAAETPTAASAFPAPRTAAAAPPPDVNRLANEVLKVIDKRVIAYRERTGRR
jgi:hypothetical protein